MTVGIDMSTTMNEMTAQWMWSQVARACGKWQVTKSGWRVTV